jgi:hypothetical protein
VLSLVLLCTGTTSCDSAREERFLEAEINSLFDARLSGHESYHRTAAPRTLIGVLTVQSEEFSFRPCRGGVRWWVEAAESTHLGDHVKRLSPERVGEFVVVWSARISEPGTFGHLGSYPHDIHVLHIQSIRVAKPGECGVPAVSGA